MKILDIFHRFRKGIIFAVGLVVLENLAWIVEPTLFGNLIDAIIDKASANYERIILIPITLWVVVYLINSVVGSFRRSVDQKIYLRMFSKVATEVAETGIKTNLPVEKIAGRAELSKEYITFFQYRVPELVEQSIAIVGAIVALSFFDWRIALTCMCIILPLVFITKLYNDRVIHFQKDLHETQESAYRIYATLDLILIKKYYADYARSEQKIANWGALNFGVMRFSLLIIFLIVLYICVDLDNFTTGNIYSIIAYLWTFVSSAEYLPDLLSSWTSINDLSTRLKTVDEVLS